MRTFLRAFLLTLAIGLVAIQLVPYGRDHQNPPVIAEPGWNSDATRALAVTACFDCHSNETEWPWYSWVAPVSWLVQADVDQGREELNLSEWGSGQESDDVAESVEEGEMPPFSYLLTHPDARLSDADRATLIQGLRAPHRRHHAPEQQRRCSLFLGTRTENAARLGVTVRAALRARLRCRPVGGRRRYPS